MVRRVDALNGMLRMERNRSENAEASIQDSLKRIAEHLKKEIEIIRQEIRKHISNDVELQNQDALICSIPGIGSVTSAVILSFMAGRKFSKAKEVAAFLGLNPRQHQSGSSVRGKTRLSKTGNAFLRSALYMPALTSLKHNPDIRAFGQRLRLAGKPGMVVVAAVMRKLIHVIFGVLHSRTDYSPQTAGGPHNI